MHSFQYLADGHHVDDAGNLIACTYVDFRGPAERFPITGAEEGVVEAARDPGLRTEEWSFFGIRSTWGAGGCGDSGCPPLTWPSWRPTPARAGRQSNVIESAFATVRLRQRVTKSAGARTRGY